MIKKLTKYPIVYLMILIIIYSVYDYFEHISRSSSTFEAHPYYWLLFCVSATLSLILILLVVKLIIQRIFNEKNLFVEVMAMGVWLALYLSILGPLIDRLCWPFDDLHFNFSIVPFFIILSGFFIIRIIINLVLGKHVFYSN